MKKKTIFKIVLMFIVLASILITHNNVSLATETTGTEPVTIGNYYNIIQGIGPRYYCIDRRAWLPYGPNGGGREFQYKLEEEITLEGSNPTNTTVRAWAYFFSKIAENENKYSDDDRLKWGALKQNPSQRAIWAAMGENTFDDIIREFKNETSEQPGIAGWNIETTESDKQFLRPAYLYATGSSSSSVEDAKLKTDDAICSILNGNIVIGPYSIDNLSSYESGDDVENGITGHEVSVEYYNGETKKLEYDSEYKIFYKYNGENKYEGDINQIPQTQGFYIELIGRSSNISLVQLKIKCKGSNPKCTVKKFVSAMTGTTEGLSYTLCSVCLSRLNGVRVYCNRK